MLRVRRVGTTVHVRVRYAQAAVQVDTLTGTIDAAFRPVDYTVFPLQSIASMTIPKWVEITDAGAVYVKSENSGGSGSNAYGTLVTSTSAAWPTSLPGTAA